LQDEEGLGLEEWDAMVCMGERDGVCACLLEEEG
jgi:hypothetical protein